MAKKILHEGELDINGMIIPCYVLDNGERVLSTAGMQKALGVIGNEPNQKSSGRLEEILSSKVVSRFISIDKDPTKFKPISAYKGQSKINAFDATILPEICEVMLKARDYAKENNIELGVRQQAVIAQADIIIRALARVGIIALVDEATGYQYEREKDELQKILKSYISAELLQWQKRFPDEFYKEIFRLNKWGEFTVSGIKAHQRPGVIGTWTKKLIYQQLPKGVLQELINKTPKNADGKLTKKLHQSLTTDMGHPHLEKQLVSVITLMNISVDWQEFLKYFNKKFGQQELEFGTDTQRKLIEPNHPKEPSTTTFDQQLRGLMAVPPPQKEKEAEQ